VTTCFLILAFYGVIAGWSFAHAAKALGGVFNTLDVNQMEGHFTRHISHPFWPIFWHLLFMCATAAIVVAGVRHGIERFSKIFMPVLLAILVLLVEGLFLPVGGLLIVTFVGWRLTMQDVASVLASNNTAPWYQSGFLFLIRFIVPVLIVAVLLKTILDGM
jgi:SNF family Na+-dependent transporter